MLDLGADADELEDARDRAAQLNEDDTPGFSIGDVWEENALAFRVFSECRWKSNVLTGLHGSVREHEGIAAEEIASVCNLIDVPAASRSDVLTCVRIMERAALPLLNARR